MRDFREILLNIYGVDIGSIWRAPNSVWKNNFAKDKEGTGFHPSMVISISKCNTSCKIVPGTSRKNNGKCVSKIVISPINNKTTYFLFFFKMDISRQDLLRMKMGWGGCYSLSESQISDINEQIINCKFKNV